MSQFPQDVIDAARASGPKYSLFPSVTLAQWALESAYGTRLSGKNNPFGIKATAGQAGTVRTTHEQNAGGVAHVEHDRFADYGSIAEAFDAHGRFLSTKRYAPVRAARTPDEACRQLRACGYATDVNYPGKLLAIIEKNGLRAIDAPTPAPPPAIATSSRKPTHKPKAAAATAVVVASGAATAAGYQGSHAWLWAFLGLAVGAAAVFAFFHFRRSR